MTKTSRELFLAFCALTTFSNLLSAQTWQGSVGGVMYNFSTVTGTFDALQGTLQSQVWYGSSATAGTFATTVANNLGSSAPYFAYDILARDTNYYLGRQYTTYIDPFFGMFGGLGGMGGSGGVIVNVTDFWANRSASATFTIASLSPPASTNITTGGTYQSSNLGATVNPILDGGILQVSSGGLISQAFTITANNGAIDQNSVASNFSGNIANSSAGVNGKLTLTNSGSGGSVTLSGNNNYSGGTEVQAGANLVIGSSVAIGSGALALVGTSTTPATLTTTASMTIANAISVTGDPIFSVAPNTTTTISSPITGSGDIEASGGGTLALTAVNTYTGPTLVDAGSTLSLSGIGSIGSSSALNNSGTVNVTGVNGSIALGGTFTQAGTGNLLMNISPTNNQKILVAGAATLAGGLTLVASAGTYTAGRYTLLTANGVSGTFGNFNSNLSSFTRLGYALGYDASNVYLMFTPNVESLPLL